MAQALVTGATSGIGQAIAIALRAAGHRVMAVGRRAELLESMAAQHGIEPLVLDIADAAATRAALDGLAVDILVNNAGMVPPLVAFCDLDEAEIGRAVGLNVTAAMLVTRRLAPGMRARGKGHIFFTGSTSGHAPAANYAVYCATKHAIAGFSQSLRLELSASGVRVTEIVAGRVETDLYRDVLPAASRAALYSGNPVVQPRDVAAMVLAAYAMPASVNVARFDILPTYPTPPSRA